MLGTGLGMLSAPGMLNIGMLNFFSFILRGNSSFSSFFFFCEFREHFLLFLIIFFLISYFSYNCSSRFYILLSSLEAETSVLHELKKGVELLDKSSIRRGDNSIQCHSFTNFKALPESLLIVKYH